MNAPEDDAAASAGPGDTSGDGSSDSSGLAAGPEAENDDAVIGAGPSGGGADNGPAEGSPADDGATGSADPVELGEVAGGIDGIDVDEVVGFTGPGPSPFAARLRPSDEAGGVFDAGGFDIGAGS